MTDEKTLQTLHRVRDPYLQDDIVSLGYVKSVRGTDRSIDVEIELPCPAKSFQNRIRSEVEAAVKADFPHQEVRIAIGTRIPSSLPATVSETLRNVKNIIAVSSGKGGVGKSTVAVHLAMALSRLGTKVGLMDADVYGPSVPKMLDGMEQPSGVEGRLLPVERHGVKFMSIGLLTDATTPVIWRGPMATKLIQTFLDQVEWGELDYLLIDLPPGTGDVQLTLTQSAPLTGAVVVTTPQEVAVGVTMRGIRMFDEVRVPILGVIENMSGFVCPHCNQETPIFRQGGGEKTAHDLSHRFLGRIPLDPRLVLAGDSGQPIVMEAFEKAADELAIQVGVVAKLTATAGAAPKKVTTDKGRISIEWADKMVSTISFRELRLKCPCAQCVDEWTGKKMLDDSKVPLDVYPKQMKPVGRYALQISWSDGHGTGLYTHDSLRSQGELTAPAPGLELPVAGATTRP